MAGEAQYYAPIIEAMIASAQQDRQKERHKLDQEKEKNDQKNKEQQIKQTQQQIDQAHEQAIKQSDIALEHLNLQKKMHDLQATESRLKAVGDLQKLIRGGASPDIVKKMPGLFAGFGGGSEQNPAFDGPSKASQLESVGIAAPQLAQQMQAAPTEMPSLYDAEAEAKNIKAEAMAKSAGAAEGELPTQEKLLGLKTEKEKELLKIKQDFDRGENKLDRASRERIEMMGNSVRLKVAGMAGGAGLDSSALKAMVQAGLTGRLKLDGNNPIERAAMGTIMEFGGKPLDPKELEALRQSQQLSPIFDKLESFIPELSKTGLGGAVKGAVLGAANKVGYSTDTQNKINILKSQALNIGKALEGMTGGRVLLSQMQLDLDSFAAGNITQKQMKDRINNLKDFYINKVDEMFLKGTPVTQRLLLYHDQGIMPGYVALAPKTSKNGKKIDVEESIKLGRAVYSD